MRAARKAPRALLLIEPQFVFRRTVATVARELNLADIHEATSVANAARMVSSARFDALIIDLDEEGAAIGLITRIRNGDSKCDRTVPIAVLAGSCDATTVTRLKELEVRRILLKPFKVKGVLDSVDALFRVPDTGS